MNKQRKNNSNLVPYIYRIRILSSIILSKTKCNFYWSKEPLNLYIFLVYNHHVVLCFIYIFPACMTTTTSPTGVETSWGWMMALTYIIV